MVVTIRRHLKTKNVLVGGKERRVVGYKNAMDAFRVAKQATIEIGAPKRVVSYSSPIERAIVGAKIYQRAFGSNGARVKLRRELGLNNIFLDEKKAMRFLEKEFGGNELAGRNSWLKGNNFGGSLRPAKEVAETIIRKRLGLGFAARIGKKGLTGKKINIGDLLIDNSTHSWIVEAIVQRLTKGQKTQLKFFKTMIWSRLMLE